MSFVLFSRLFFLENLSLPFRLSLLRISNALSENLPKGIPISPRLGKDRPSSPRFYAELLMIQMALFRFIIENYMRMHEENLVEVLLLYRLVHFH